MLYLNGNLCEQLPKALFDYMMVPMWKLHGQIPHVHCTCSNMCCKKDNLVQWSLSISIPNTSATYSQNLVKTL